MEGGLSGDEAEAEAQPEAVAKKRMRNFVGATKQAKAIDDVRLHFFGLVVFCCWRWFFALHDAVHDTASP